jgi:hypothetical protein
MLTYLVIGLLVAVLIDVAIRVNKTGEPFTSTEIWACIFLWPVVLYHLLRGFFGNQN